MKLVKLNPRHSLLGIVWGAVILCVFCSLAHGQVRSVRAASENGRVDKGDGTTKAELVEQIISNAQQIYLEGIEGYKHQNFMLARQKFDEALDSLFFSPIDLNSDSRLKNYYQTLIDNISSLQINSAQARQETFGIQLYTPTPTDELAQVTDEELKSLGESGTAVSAGDFDFKATLQGPVYEFISYFTSGKGRQTMLLGLQRAGRYRTMAEKIFQEEGVPRDLIWLAQVESLWSSSALSDKAARGMWQFIPGTGARFGLSQTAWVDERSDPAKATRAAARYLKYLANYFGGDWVLAMAAYNCGEGRVDGALRRGGDLDYWTLRSRGLLPNETRNYVPAILAAIAIAKNPKQYGFDVVPDEPLQFKTHTVKTQTSLAAFAQAVNVPLGTMLALNPELQHGTTPPGAYTLRIPKQVEVPEFVARPVVKQSRKRSIIVSRDPETTPNQ